MFFILLFTANNNNNTSNNKTKMKKPTYRAVELTVRCKLYSLCALIIRNICPVFGNHYPN